LLQFYGIKRIATYLPDEHQFAVVTELHDEYNGAPLDDIVAEDDQLVAELLPVKKVTKKIGDGTGRPFH